MDDKSLIKGLREHDKPTVKYIFHKFFPMIENLVRTNGKGDRQEAEDVFMNALEVMYLKSEEDDFKLSSSFSTLFYEICKRQWLKILAYKKKIVRVTFDVQSELIEDSLATKLEQAEQYQLYREKFEELSEGCRKVLKMSLEGSTMKDIAKTQGYASEQYARKRKFKCKEKLIQLIKKDLRYQELKDYD